MSEDLEKYDYYDDTKTFNGPMVESYGIEYFVGEEDYSYSDYPTGYDQEYYDTSDEEYYEDGNWGSTRSTCNVYPDPRPRPMVAMFCDNASEPKS